MSTKMKISTSLRFQDQNLRNTLQRVIQRRLEILQFYVLLQERFPVPCDIVHSQMSLYKFVPIFRNFFSQVVVSFEKFQNISIKTIN